MWSSGSIEVPGLSKHVLFLIVVTFEGGTQETLIGFRGQGEGADGSRLVAMGNASWQSNSSSHTSVSAFRCSVSGETLSSPIFTRALISGGYTYSFVSVSKIVGII